MSAPARRMDDTAAPFASLPAPMSAPERSTGLLQSQDGLSLFTRSLRPEAPKRAVLLVHGFAEHSGRYEALMSDFAARGFAAHAFDHRGHGRSEGVRCHVDRFERYLDDVETALAELADASTPGPKPLILGHSMGGLIVLALLAQRRPRLAGAVVSAPALAALAGLPRPLRPLLHLAARVAPRLALPSGLDPNALCRDPEVVRRYLEDPLIRLRITLGLAAALQRGAASAAALAGKIGVPLLLLHGEADSICPVAASRAFFAGVSAPGSALRTWPGLRHETLNEPEREQVLAAIFDWIEKEIP